MSAVILAVETATEYCSAALWCGGEVIERSEAAPRRHAELLLPQCEAVLAEAGLGRRDIDVVAFGRGPGAFTGLRIAAGVAQGLALGLDRPVVPVSSLAAMAVAVAGLRPDGEIAVLTAFDARMGEVYWGGYRWGPGGLVGVFEEAVQPPDAVALPPPGEWLAAGTGWAAHGEALVARCLAAGVATTMVADAWPTAAGVAHLAASGAFESVSAAEAAPVYLRPWRPGS